MPDKEETNVNVEPVFPDLTEIYEQLRNRPSPPVVMGRGASVLMDEPQEKVSE